MEGLRNKDSRITREYFYKYCRIAYCIYDRRYSLQNKPGLDFYSIAHEYYLSLDRHDFCQLNDRHQSMTLKTWMINGFRFVLLDRLKAYKKEYRIASMEERIEKSSIAFDIPDNNYRKEVREMVREACDHLLGRDVRDAIILKMLLVEGFKAKEIAEQLGITPSAVSQRHHKLLDTVIIPYFQQNYDTMFESKGACMAMPCDDAAMPEPLSFNIYEAMKPIDYTARTTPDMIESLAPNEVFVFGSNLAGMHGGGAARLYFGAVMGNGDGMQGQSYAIPTMQGGVDTIRPYVNKFIDYARQHPELRFLVTRIGCGIAGFNPEEIAPLFEEARNVENISLPNDFWEYLEC